jgi:hypothetical protein
MSHIVRELRLPLPCGELDGNEDRRWLELVRRQESHCVRIFQVRDHRSHAHTNATAEIAVFTAVCFDFGMESTQ